MNLYDTLQKHFWALVLLAFLLVALPFLTVQSIPFIDHPNHMARFHILQNYDSSPELQSLYTLKDGFYPYWGMEGFMRVFTPLIGVERAGWLFAIASIAMPLIGVLSINRAVTGKTHPLVFTALIFVFSGVAAWGFLNYLFTIGVVMIVFAAWIKTDGKSLIWRVPLFAIAALAITCMHVISAAFLGLFLGLWELYPILKSRRITKNFILTNIGIALIFVPSALLYLSLSAEDFGKQTTRWGEFEFRIEALTSPFMFLISGSRVQDVAVLAGFAAFALLVWIGVKSNRAAKDNSDAVAALGFHARLLFVTAIVFILAWIAPSEFRGVAYVSYRIPIIAALLFISALWVKPDALPKWLTPVMLSLIAIKGVAVHLEMQKIDAHVAEFRQASSVIPKGSRVFTVMHTDPDSIKRVGTTPVGYTHMIGYLVLERDILFPYMFSMFDVTPAPAHESYTVPHDFAVDRKYLDSDHKAARKYAKNWREDFDYILYLNFTHNTAPAIDTTKVISEGSWFEILEIKTPAQ